MEVATLPDSHDQPVRRRWARDLIALSLWLLLVVTLVRVGHDHRAAGAHHHGAASIESGRAFLSWVLMTAVMMLPTTVPVLRALDDLTASRRGTGLLGRFDVIWWAFVGGYLAMWIGFAALAAGLQVVLGRSDALGAAGELRSTVLAAAVLMVAGIYQFTVWKQACLSGCTRPMTFFLVHWRDGALGGVRMGARHAVTCIGCCWALMALAFVGGIHSLWFMVIATVLMVVEKLPAVGQRARVPIGVLLIVGSVAMVAGWLR